MMRTIYLWSKTLHRITMWGVLVLGLVMMITGLLMKYTQILDKVPVVSPIFVRYVHNQLSFVFSLVLGVMMLTGFAMYYLPGWIQDATKKAAPDTPTQTPTTPVK